MRYTPFALLFAAASALAQTNAPTLTSPDGRLAIAFQTVTAKQTNAATGRLVYSVTFQNQPVLEKSGLRLDLRGQQSLGTNMQIVAVTNWTTDDTYRVVAGKANPVRNHFNALRLE